MSRSVIEKFVRNATLDSNDTISKDEEEDLYKFPDLRHANFNKVTSFGDKLIQGFCGVAYNLEYLELNQLERFSDMTIPKILKVLKNIKVIQMNQTPNITDEKLEEMREAYPHIQIVRNIQEYTSEKDNGLRMPYRNKSTVKKTKKKKKK